MSEKKDLKTIVIADKFPYGTFGKELSHLIKSIVMPGSIELAYGRDPDFYHSLEIEGKFNQVAICYYEENDEINIVGLSTRSIKPMYINGEEKDFGYIGGLRSRPNFRGGISKRLFSQLYEKHFSDNKTPSYITTIIENNVPAFDALVNPRPGVPGYVNYGKIHTHAINVNKRKKLKKHNIGIEIKRGNPENLSEIVKFLNEEGKKKQFYPAYTEEDFKSNYTRDFDIKNFYVAYKNEKVVGVVSKWDQSKYKQSIVMGYNGAMKIFRPIINSALKLMGYNVLPDPNKELKMFYLSFACVKDDDVEILNALIDNVHFDNKDSGYNYMIIAFHEDDPLLKAMKKYSSVKYTSVLFLVEMDPGKDFTSTLDRDLVPYMEIGTL